MGGICPPGHGRSTRVDMSSPPVIQLANLQGGSAGRRRCRLTLVHQVAPRAVTAHATGSQFKEGGSSPVHREAGESYGQQRRPVCEPCLPRANRAFGNVAEQMRPRFRSGSARCGRQSCADGVRTVEAPGKDELWQHRMPRATRRTAHATDPDAMDDPAIAHVAAVGAVERHGLVARHAARARDDEPISEAGILLHAQLEREDRGDGSFYRNLRLLDRGPSSKSVARTGPFLTTKRCRQHRSQRSTGPRSGSRPPGSTRPR
jgi:hypothetical protein